MTILSPTMLFFSRLRRMNDFEVLGQQKLFAIFIIYKIDQKPICWCTRVYRVTAAHFSLSNYSIVRARNASLPYLFHPQSLLNLVLLLPILLAVSHPSRRKARPRSAYRRSGKPALRPANLQLPGNSRRKLDLSSRSPPSS